MRIRLGLTFKNRAVSIPFNYQYHLASATYGLLSAASPEYALFLHDHGYIGPDGKLRKLFTFSKLLATPQPRPQGPYLLYAKESKIELFISSPMIQEFIQHLIMGMFHQQRIFLPSANGREELLVEQVETLIEPVFSQECRFKTMSPMTLTTRIDTEEGSDLYFYRPLDEALPQAIRKNLIAKHQATYGGLPEDDRLDFIVDEDYIHRRGGPEKVSKLITIREGHADATKVKAFEAPFTLKGSTELMRTAWECGIGDKCSMGFGCIDVIK
jgi:CRISPR-associated endoribonuclease Cas6